MKKSVRIHGDSKLLIIFYGKFLVGAFTGLHMWMSCYFCGFGNSTPITLYDFSNRYHLREGEGFVGGRQGQLISQYPDQTVHNFNKKNTCKSTLLNCKKILRLADFQGSEFVKCLVRIYLDGLCSLRHKLIIMLLWRAQVFNAQYHTSSSYGTFFPLSLKTGKKVFKIEVKILLKGSFNRLCNYNR